MADIATVIRDRRHELGMYQRQLAERSGVAPRTISNIETGARVPRADTLRLVAAALGTTEDAILARALARAFACAPGLGWPLEASRG